MKKILIKKNKKRKNKKKRKETTAVCYIRNIERLGTCKAFEEFNMIRFDNSYTFHLLYCSTFQTMKPRTLL